MKTLDRLLEDVGLTTAELAERAGLPLERIEAIAAGRWTPGPQDRTVIAQVFGLSVDEIVWGHTLDPRNVRYRRFGLSEDF